MGWKRERLATSSLSKRFRSQCDGALDDNLAPVQRRGATNGPEVVRAYYSMTNNIKNPVLDYWPGAMSVTRWPRDQGFGS